MVRVGELEERQTVDGREEPLRSVADAETSHRVAGRVERDRLRKDGPDVRDPEDVDEELRELVDVRRQRGDPVRQPRLTTLVGGSRGHRWMLAADHRRTGRRRCHDGVVALEGVREPADQRDALVAIARIEVHLTAAGLTVGEPDVLTEPAQESDHGTAHVGEQQVVEAGDEDRDAHGGQPSLWVRAVRGS